MCVRCVSFGHFTCDSIQHYCFVCTDMEQRVHKVASLGDIPGKVKIKDKEALFNVAYNETDKIS